MVVAKCKNCGANIQMEVDKRAGVCPQCGGAYIPDDSVNNYNSVNLDNSTQNIVQNIYNIQEPKKNEYAERGDTFIGLGCFEDAKKNYLLSIENYPSDSRGWFGMVKYYTENFEDLSDKRHLEYIEKARNVASTDELLHIMQEYNLYISRVKKESYESESLAREREAEKQALRIRKTELNGFQTFESVYDDENKKLIAIFNKSLAVCPFCGQADWHINRNKCLVKCGTCFVEAIPHANLSGGKIKRLDIKKSGTSGAALGKQGVKSLKKKIKKNQTK